MFTRVSPTHLNDWLASLPGQPLPLVIDVREPWEVQIASISPAGFELLHLPMGQIPSQLATLDPDRPTACLCHHGVRSLHVATFLVNQGFETVANIDGGIDAWSRERDPAVPLY
jgi:rhodanese-related sulfurtransferase